MRPLPRLLLSLLVGLVVSGISGEIAYQQYLNSGYWLPRDITMQDMARLSRAVDAYRQERHALPRGWSGVGTVTGHADRLGAPLDAWGHPMHYWTDGKRYRITS